MGPAFLSGLKAVSLGAAALSSHAQGMNEAARLEGEARLAETQTLQRDTLARDDLSRTLSGIRSARAANGLSATSPNALLLMRETTSVSARERQIRRADGSQRVANLRAGASSARKGARLSLFTGGIKSAVPLIQHGIYANG